MGLVIDRAAGRVGGGLRVFPDGLRRNDGRVALHVTVDVLIAAAGSQHAQVNAGAVFSKDLPGGTLLGTDRVPLRIRRVDVEPQDVRRFRRSAQLDEIFFIGAGVGAVAR